MRLPHLRTTGPTLRFRLTLWNTAVMLILMLATLAAGREGLRFTIGRMLDEFLGEELEAACAEVGRFRPGTGLRDRLDQRARAHPRRQLFVQILDARGQVAWSSPHAPPSDRLLAVASGAPARTAGNYRLLDRTVAGADGQLQTVRIGCSLARARLEVARFTSIFLAAAAVLLPLAPLGGYLLARRASRPIARVTATARRLEPSHLAERLPLTGSGDELDQLAGTINGFLDRIAAHLEQNREFTANAAHELRSPLAALRTSLEVALQADRSAEEYRDVLAVLLEECGQLCLLVNQLLLLAEGDAGRLRLRPRPVRLDEVIHRCLDLFGPAAEAAGLELRPGTVEPVVLEGDGERLWQVLNHLLDNAVKFTPAGGRIEVGLCLDGPVREGVLTVTDTGVGIAPVHLPHIFDRFNQVDPARDRETGARGVGLGLSICRMLVVAHGGTITVASTPGVGTTFTVRFPTCARPAPTACPAQLEVG